MGKSHVRGITEIDSTVGNVRIKVSGKRLQRNKEKAQFALDIAVMQDMVPYMPFQTGEFIQRTLIDSLSMAGTGKICAGANPQGRFLYEGKVMVGEHSRSAYAKLGEKKVITDKPLTYANDRGPHWFEKAKEVNLDRWERVVKEEMRKR